MHHFRHYISRLTLFYADFAIYWLMYYIINALNIIYDNLMLNIAIDIAIDQELTNKIMYG